MATVSTNVLARNYDLVHSFGRLGYLLPVLPLPIPKLMSYQRAIPSRTITWAERLSRGTLHFSGCSRHLIEPYAERPNWHVVYNGVPIDKYVFEGQVADDAPLVFLGRVEHIKGTHHAIEVAQQTGRQLVIAGNVDEEHRDYFEERVAPHLDGEQIQFVGPVGDEEKDDLLGRAAAFLMPILWEEPFGIVMAEALACGTPVIGLDRGSVPEVVDDGVNGYVCSSVDEMVEAVEAIEDIDRRACRRSMEERFSDRAVLQGYEDVYDKMLSDGRS
jgi:glycosyltransferase involved in cell wall biosynthesis